MTIRFAAASLCFALLACVGRAAEPEASPIPAAELAARLSAKQQDGTSLIRLRMEMAGKGTLQLQIKSRASRAGTDLVYQVLFPKERKGEAVLLRKSDGRISGSVFTPADGVRPLTAAQLDEPLFGSDLSYEDVIENFFAWGQQAVVGTEVVDRVNCTILESKPGKGERSSYASVRTWVDTRRMVPLRVEKYDAPGRVVRRIDTARVVTDDKGRAIPANLTIRGPRGSTTNLDGSRIKHDVTFADAEFTPEGIKSGAAAPPSASE
ncbi:MAG TPA: outer membrane lipoprotein-sorting protein [Chthoniobacteraceae bacterium]|nr:outer membrane lipoprotein-sorting protein [Chthoniobacteraceae bacterium]